LSKGIRHVRHTQTALALSIGLLATFVIPLSIRVFAQPYQENSILASKQNLGVKNRSNHSN